MHVAGVLVLGPPEGGRPSSAEERYRQIRRVVEERLDVVPRLRRRAVRVPLGLQRPAWVEEPHLDLDAHVRRAAVPAPGGRKELDDLVAEIMSRPLDLHRPLWEMVVVEGLERDRTAVVARLHHAILDGVSGATAMATFLDLEPPVTPPPARDGTAQCSGDAPEPADAVARNGAEPQVEPTAEPTATAPAASPSLVSRLRYAAGTVRLQPEATLEAVRRGLDAMVELAAQNRELAAQGSVPPPAFFSAPRTRLNANLTGERTYASLAVPLEDFEAVRAALNARAAPAADGGSTQRSPDAITVNDVILSATGGAVARYLHGRGELPSTSLVALVPVSTRGHAEVPESGVAAEVGNHVSGMLVTLATTEPDPIARLRAVSRAARVAKRQEQRAGGDLLEGFTRAIPPVLMSLTMRGIGWFHLFDRLPPPFNVVVSSVVIPDVSLWWAGCPVVDVYPAGPVADGVGLNVTSMTYKGTVHFGLLAGRKVIPDVAALAVLLDDAVAELVALAMEGSGTRSAGRRQGTRGAARVPRAADRPRPPAHVPR